MEVVTSPSEMRAAVERLSALDLILIDTAGRSPHDEVKIRELQSFLEAARTDEVHLVLSVVGGTRSLIRTLERFGDVGTTGLIFSKLDEAGGMGNIIPVMRRSKLPLHYLTTGQSVPDDIEEAHSGRLSRLILGVDKLY
jgi:flagellar biosynthesis protein FlhF